MRWLVDISTFFAAGLASLPNTVLGKAMTNSYVVLSRLFLTFRTKLSQIRISLQAPLQVPHRRFRVLHQAHYLFKVPPH